MSTELLQQRKIPVGLEGAPTYIGELHERYGDEPQRFHSYCREHEHFGSCGTLALTRGKHWIENEGWTPSATFAKKAEVS